MTVFKTTRNIMYAVAAALGIGVLAGVLTFFLFTTLGVAFDGASLVGAIVGCLVALIVAMDDD